MWLAGSEVSDLYIGTRATLLAQGADVLQARSHAGFDDALVGVASLAEQIKPKAALRVWLSGGLCRPFLLPAMPELKDGAERRRAALAIARQGCALDGELELRMVKPASTLAQIGMALEKRVLDAILQQLAGLPLQMLAPWWMNALNCLLKIRPELQCIGVQDCDALTVLRGRGGQFEQVSTLAPSYDIESAKAGYRRMQFSSSLAPDRVAPLLVLRANRSGSDVSGLPTGLALSSFVSMER
ncbi:hypothetical protein RQP53_00060 [Paucibacter sp. APW11]|uniref:Uncharacterized protein n=1 Tax=Roseateles aquae TaxID=3077235 RepID=A0ABU3P506_9BURK|nr:hypothetical protein [Paucibacter sp. APW11]MDT8997660.1 hypothetical protein [Paucibacter sp. APW11]